MPKTGSNIYKRRDGRWEGRYRRGYRENGGIAYGYVYASTCGEVKRRLGDKRTQPQARVKTTVTFAEAASRWLSGAALRVKASTRSTYAALLERHILPTIGGYPIRQVTSGLINALAAEKIEGVGLSPKTVRDFLSLVKSVLDYACTENLIDAAVTVTYPKQTGKTMRVLSADEQTALERVLTREPEDICKLGVLLCLYTGLRIGEVCALRWDDISINDGILSVKHAVQRMRNFDGDAATKILFDTPKSRCSIRDIPIPDFLIPRLLKLVRANKAFLLSGNSNKPMEPRTLQNKFRRYVNEAGIASVNFHALRHTFATRCVEAGVDIKSLSEMLGHAGVNITLNKYVHSSLEQKRVGMRKLESFSSL
jgi:integrase